MKVESGRSVGPSTSPKRSAGAVAAGFSPASVEEAPHVAATGAVNAVTALDTILALQAEEPLSQRRARQAKRGRTVLDALEELEAGLLAGRAPAALRTQLEHLQRTAESTGEPSLDGVLREIDTRLAVELAKLDQLVGTADAAPQRNDFRRALAPSLLNGRRRGPTL
ncbi:MAG: flagellar assembly protein FliX [Proteobacteria bacterium]|nr:flagellar assembly protein FliX [Pseudomonadota bacterium]